MSGDGLRPLLQFRVTPWPSTTSAEGLMRRCATGRGGSKEGSGPLHPAAPMPPAAGRPPGFSSPHMTVGRSGLCGISSMNVLISGEFVLQCQF